LLQFDLYSIALHLRDSPTDLIRQPSSNNAVVVIASAKHPFAPARSLHLNTEVTFEFRASIFMVRW